MMTHPNHRLKVIAGLMAAIFLYQEIAWAAPGGVPAAGAASIPMVPPLGINGLIANPGQIDIPFDAVTLQEVHAGTNGKLIIHIQDAHANLSGQQSLAKTVEHFLTKYGLKVVLVEGADRDVTLDPIRKLAPLSEWKIIARRFLYEGIVSGEEYLNLTSEQPMKLRGVEYQDLYNDAVRAYASLVDRRKDILHYLYQSKVSLDRLKARMYPQTLLDYEKKKAGVDPDLGGDFKDQTEGLFALCEAGGMSLQEYPQMTRMKELFDKEKSVDFERANREQVSILSRVSPAAVKSFAEASRRLKSSQVSQYRLIQQLLADAGAQGLDPAAFPALTEYSKYLEKFMDLKMEALMAEQELLEDRIFEKILPDDDARKVRAIDRFLGLLGHAYKLQMSSHDFKMFEFNEKDFPTESWLAFMNRKLADLGFFESMVPNKSYLEDARADFGKFYNLVGQRDEAFVENAHKIMAEEKTDAVVLIAGGYHTDHLTELLRAEGTSYIVLTPLVTDKTDQDKYEEILLSQLKSQEKHLAAHASDPNSHPDTGSDRAQNVAMTRIPRGVRAAAAILRLSTGLGARLSDFVGAYQLGLQAEIAKAASAQALASPNQRRSKPSGPSTTIIGARMADAGREEVMKNLNATSEFVTPDISKHPKTIFYAAPRRVGLYGQRGNPASNERDWFKQVVNRDPAGMLIGLNDSAWNTAVRRDAKVIIVGDKDEEVIKAQEFLYKPLILEAKSPAEFLSMLASVRIPPELQQASLDDVFEYIEAALDEDTGVGTSPSPDRASYVKEIVSRLRHNPDLTEQQALFVERHLNWMIRPKRSFEDAEYKGAFDVELARQMPDPYVSFRNRYYPKGLLKLSEQLAGSDPGVDYKKVIYQNDFSFLSSAEAFQTLRNLFASGNVYYFVGDLTRPDVYEAIGDLSKRLNKKISGLSVSNIPDTTSVQGSARASILFNIIGYMRTLENAVNFRIDQTRGIKLPYEFASYDIAPDSDVLEILGNRGYDVTHLRQRVNEPSAMPTQIIAGARMSARTPAQTGADLAEFTGQDFSKDIGANLDMLARGQGLSYLNRILEASPSFEAYAKDQTDQLLAAISISEGPDRMGRFYSFVAKNYQERNAQHGAHIRSNDPSALTMALAAWTLAHRALQAFEGQRVTKSEWEDHQFHTDHLKSCIQLLEQDIRAVSSERAVEMIGRYRTESSTDWVPRGHMPGKDDPVYVPSPELTRTVETVKIRIRWPLVPLFILLFFFSMITTVSTHVETSVERIWQWMSSPSITYVWPDISINKRVETDNVTSVGTGQAHVYGPGTEDPNKVTKKGGSQAGKSKNGNTAPKGGSGPSAKRIPESGGDVTKHTDPQGKGKVGKGSQARIESKKTTSGATVGDQRGQLPYAVVWGADGQLKVSPGGAVAVDHKLFGPAIRRGEKPVSVWLVGPDGSITSTSAVDSGNVGKYGVDLSVAPGIALEGPKLAEFLKKFTVRYSVRPGEYYEYQADLDSPSEVKRRSHLELQTIIPGSQITLPGMSWLVPEPLVKETTTIIETRRDGIGSWLFIPIILLLGLFNRGPKRRNQPTVHPSIKQTDTPSLLPTPMSDLRWDASKAQTHITSAARMAEVIMPRFMEGQKPVFFDEYDKEPVTFDELIAGAFPARDRQQMLEKAHKIFATNGFDLIPLYHNKDIPYDGRALNMIEYLRIWARGYPVITVDPATGRTILETEDADLLWKEIEAQRGKEYRKARRAKMNASSEYLIRGWGYNGPKGRSILGTDGPSGRRVRPFIPLPSFQGSGRNRGGRTPAPFNNVSDWEPRNKTLLADDFKHGRLVYFKGRIYPMRITDSLTVPKAEFEKLAKPVPDPAYDGGKAVLARKRAELNQESEKYNPDALARIMSVANKENSLLKKDIDMESQYAVPGLTRKIQKMLRAYYDKLEPFLEHLTHDTPESFSGGVVTATAMSGFVNIGSVFLEYYTLVKNDGSEAGSFRDDREIIKYFIDELVKARMRYAYQASDRFSPSEFMPESLMRKLQFEYVGGGYLQIRPSEGSADTTRALGYVDGSAEIGTPVTLTELKTPYFANLSEFKDLSPTRRETLARAWLKFNQLRFRSVMGKKVQEDRPKWKKAAKTFTRERWSLLKQVEDPKNGAVARLGLQLGQRLEPIRSEGDARLTTAGIGWRLFLDQLRGLKSKTPKAAAKQKTRHGPNGWAILKEVTGYAALLTAVFFIGSLIFTQFYTPGLTSQTDSAHETYDPHKDQSAFREPPKVMYENLKVPAGVDSRYIATGMYGGINQNGQPDGRQLFPAPFKEGESSEGPPTTYSSRIFGGNSDYLVAGDPASILTRGVRLEGSGSRFEVTVSAKAYDVPEHKYRGAPDGLIARFKEQGLVFYKPAHGPLNRFMLDRAISEILKYMSNNMVYSNIEPAPNAEWLNRLFGQNLSAEEQRAMEAFADKFGGRRGVMCQEAASFMMSALRVNGFRAVLVRGFLNKDGGDKLTTQEMHAWVLASADGKKWVLIDATTGLIQAIDTTPLPQDSRHQTMRSQDILKYMTIGSGIFTGLVLMTGLTLMIARRVGTRTRSSVVQASSVPQTPVPQTSVLQAPSNKKTSDRSFGEWMNMFREKDRQILESPDPRDQTGLAAGVFNDARLNQKAIAESFIAGLRSNRVILRSMGLAESFGVERSGRPYLSVVNTPGVGSSATLHVSHASLSVPADALSRADGGSALSGQYWIDFAAPAHDGTVSAHDIQGARMSVSSVLWQAANALFRAAGLAALLVGEYYAVRVTAWNLSHPEPYHNFLTYAVRDLLMQILFPQMLVVVCSLIIAFIPEGIRSILNPYLPKKDNSPMKVNIKQHMMVGFGDFSEERDGTSSVISMLAAAVSPRVLAVIAVPLLVAAVSTIVMFPYLVIFLILVVRPFVRYAKEVSGIRGDKAKIIRETAVARAGLLLDALGSGPDGRRFSEQERARLLKTVEKNILPTHSLTAAGGVGWSLKKWGYAMYINPRLDVDDGSLEHVVDHELIHFFKMRLGLIINDVPMAMAYETLQAVDSGKVKIVELEAAQRSEDSLRARNGLGAGKRYLLLYGISLARDRGLTPEQRNTKAIEYAKELAGDRGEKTGPEPFYTYYLGVIMAGMIHGIATDLVADYSANYLQRPDPSLGFSSKEKRTRQMIFRLFTMLAKGETLPDSLRIAPLAIGAEGKDQQGARTAEPAKGARLADKPKVEAIYGIFGKLQRGGVLSEIEFEDLLRQVIDEDKNAIRDRVRPLQPGEDAALRPELTEEECGGMCAISAFDLKERFKSFSPSSIRVLTHHVANLFGVQTNHAFSVVTYGQQAYLVDTTIRQFYDPKNTRGAPLAEKMRAADRSMNTDIFDQLRKNGFVKFSEEALKVYADGFAGSPNDLNISELRRSMLDQEANQNPEKFGAFFILSTPDGVNHPTPQIAEARKRNMESAARMAEDNGEADTRVTGWNDYRSDIQTAQNRLREVLDKLPRIGMHGERAGHTPDGQFWFFIYDKNESSYWKPPFRNARIYPRGAEASSVFMDPDEFFERLFGTLFMAGSYGSDPSLEHGPDIYLVPETVAHKLPSIGKREKEETVIYDPFFNKGFRDFKTFHSEGQIEADPSIQERSKIIKIDKNEMDMALSWAEEFTPRPPGAKPEDREAMLRTIVKYFVNQIIYKKSLDALYQIAVAEGLNTPAASAGIARDTPTPVPAGARMAGQPSAIEEFLANATRLKRTIPLTYKPLDQAEDSTIIGIDPAVIKAGYLVGAVVATPNPQMNQGKTAYFFRIADKYAPHLNQALQVTDEGVDVYKLEDLDKDKGGIRSNNNKVETNKLIDLIISGQVVCHVTGSSRQFFYLPGYGQQDGDESPDPRPESPPSSQPDLAGRIDGLISLGTYESLRDANGLIKTLGKDPASAAKAQDLYDRRYFRWMILLATDVQALKKAQENGASSNRTPLEILNILLQDKGSRTIHDDKYKDLLEMAIKARDALTEKARNDKDIAEITEEITSAHNALSSGKRFMASADRETRLKTLLARAKQLERQDLVEEIDRLISTVEPIVKSTQAVQQEAERANAAVLDLKTIMKNSNADLERRRAGLSAVQEALTKYEGIRARMRSEGPQDQEVFKNTMNDFDTAAATQEREVKAIEAQIEAMQRIRDGYSKAAEFLRPGLSEVIASLDDRTSSPENPIRISFVCTANFNRSPAMAGILKVLLAKAGIYVEINSFGMMSTGDLTVSGLLGQHNPEVLRELETRDRDARRLTGAGDLSLKDPAKSVDAAAGINKRDLIITADDEHRSALIELHPDMESRIMTFGQLLFEAADPDALVGEIQTKLEVKLSDDLLSKITTHLPDPQPNLKLDPMHPDAGGEISASDLAKLVEIILNETLVPKLVAHLSGPAEEPAGARLAGEGRVGLHALLAGSTSLHGLVVQITGMGEKWSIMVNTPGEIPEEFNFRSYKDLVAIFMSAGEAAGQLGVPDGVGGGAFVREEGAELYTPDHTIIPASSPVPSGSLQTALGNSSEMVPGMGMMDAATFNTIIRQFRRMRDKRVPILLMIKGTVAEDIRTMEPEQQQVFLGLLKTLLTDNTFVHVEGLDPHLDTGDQAPANALRGTIAGVGQTLFTPGEGAAMTQGLLNPVSLLVLPLILQAKGDSDLSRVMESRGFSALLEHPSPALAKAMKEYSEAVAILLSKNPLKGLNNANDFVRALALTLAATASAA